MVSGQSDEASALVDESIADITALGPTAATDAQYLTPTLLGLERYSEARAHVLRTISEARQARGPKRS